MREPVLVDLALQGGGSHGAFRWGVLDRILEEPWLKIDGISGTSAGAMKPPFLLAVMRKADPNKPGKLLMTSGAASQMELFTARLSDRRSICC